MAQWAHDGTQDPEPPPLMGDPLSGLVTGSRFEPEAVTVRVVDPPMPDISEVRKVVAQVLGDDEVVDDAVDAVLETANLPQDIPAPAPAPSVEEAPQAVAPPPAPPRQPPPPPVRQPPPPRELPPAVITGGKPAKDGSGRGTPAPGMIVAIVLVVVMIIIGIVVIGSLVETISSILD